MGQDVRSVLQVEYTGTSDKEISRRDELLKVFRVQCFLLHALQLG